MILDDINLILYFDRRNKKIRLTKTESDLIKFFIKNKNKKIKLEEIIKYLYDTDKHLETYKYSARNIIYRLNFKMQPYAKINSKSKVGYYLTENLNYFKLWKKDFFDAHKDERELLNLYKKKEILEKNIKTLEKNIS